jgi:hypothetical protein
MYECTSRVDISPAKRITFRLLLSQADQISSSGSPTYLMSAFMNTQPAVDQDDEPFAADYTPLLPLFILTARPWSIFQELLPTTPSLQGLPSMQLHLVCTPRDGNTTPAYAVPHACRWSTGPEGVHCIAEYSTWLSSMCDSLPEVVYLFDSNAYKARLRQWDRSVRISDTLHSQGDRSAS